MSDTTTTDLSALEAAAVEAQAAYEIVKDDRNVDYMVRQEASWAATRARVAFLDTKVGVEGRTAKCSCGATTPSTHDLFGFEYRGPGSDWLAKRCGVCRYSPLAHKVDEIVQGPRRPFHGHAFVPSEPQEMDSYYCGCRGWD